MGVTFVEDAIWGSKDDRSGISVSLRYPHRPSRQLEMFYLEYNELSAKDGADKATGKERYRLKRMRKFKKNNLDPLTQRRKNIGEDGVPTSKDDLKKMHDLYKNMAKKLNHFLGTTNKDLRR